MKILVNIPNEEYIKVMEQDDFHLDRDIILDCIRNGVVYRECDTQNCIDREATKQSIRDFFPNLDDRCEINSVINMMPPVFPKDYYKKKLDDIRSEVEDVFIDNMCDEYLTVLDIFKKHIEKIGEKQGDNE